MSHRNKFTELAKSVLGHKRVLVTPRIMHPNREWGIGLILACSIFFASTVWSIQTYGKYKEDKTLEVEMNKSGPEQYRAALVEEAQSIMKERSLKYNEILSNIKFIETVVVEVEKVPVIKVSTSSETNLATTSVEMVNPTSTPIIVN